MAYYDRDNIERVSQALSELRYNEMLALGRDLADIANDRDVFGANPNVTGKDIADLLADWSFAKEQEIEEAEAEAEKETA